MYNILIVDDEKIERNGIKLLLKRMGINLGIIEAENGKEAYDYLMSDDNKGEGHVDILLTDVKMPFMDGIELIRNVKDGGVKLKTIIFSGYNEFEYAKLAVKLGVEDYILKPVAPDEFKNTMLKIISELDEELRKNEDYNKQANSLRQFYLYSLINGSAARIQNFSMVLTDLCLLNLIRIFSESMSLILIRRYRLLKRSGKASILTLIRSSQLYC